MESTVIDVEKLKGCTKIPRCLGIFLDELENYYTYGENCVSVWNNVAGDEYMKENINIVIKEWSDIRQRFSGCVIDICDEVVRAAINIMDICRWIHSMDILMFELEDRMAY